MVIRNIKWALEIPKKKKGTNNENSETGQSKKKFPVCLPYVEGTSEKLHRIFKSHGVPSYHKPFNTLKSLLVHPKDKTPKEKQCGLVYSAKCKICDKKYIGETARTFKTRFNEHTDGKHPNSAINEHTESTGHTFNIDDTKILVKEQKLDARKIREAICIHKERPELNRDKGQEIPAILLNLIPNSQPPRNTPSGLF